MGVAWVFETKESARSIELSLEQAGAVLHGAAKTFKVDCTLYRPPTNVAGQIGSFYLLHHSYYPESSFIIGAPQITTPDSGFDLILSKFSAGLVADHAGKMELMGNEYHLKDFRIRVGTVSAGQATSVKGVIIEIEYGPSNVISQCKSILKELIELFFPGQTQGREPEIFQRHTHADSYMPVDTVSQYLDIFLAMRKKA
ncbi:TATA-binding related factor (TRF) of subunit 20 of mediator complex domain-containing protein [Ditylenchus destructor]|uniref:Mediator of RNA polymerase II transcription subunit 20 n=1 Tax=Ditylenchus destructor TaxID=166010 RepID=A0AAD4N093_9BILA|nr:TATA-binding related factor (TRF) of subunit 20 of mediator complex domain-containing protein [Ditylenchus destructor]